MHGENFRRFCSFLSLNGLPNIYEEDCDRREGPMDNIIRRSKLYPPVTPLDYKDLSEVEERFKGYFKELDTKIARLKNK